MKKFKKLMGKALLLIAAFVFGVAAKPAQASCMVSVTLPDGSPGFVSCGSTAGNYLATCSGGCRTIDAPYEVGWICYWVCDM